MALKANIRNAKHHFDKTLCKLLLLNASMNSKSESNNYLFGQETPPMKIIIMPN